MNKLTWIIQKDHDEGSVETTESDSFWLKVIYSTSWERIIITRKLDSVTIFFYTISYGSNDLKVTVKELAEILLEGLLKQ